MNNITISGITIQVIKKNIKNIRLSVHPPDGQVRLAIPEKMDDIAINEFVMSKISWIEKHKSNFILQDKQQEKKFISGEEHLYLGNKYILKVLETSGKQYVELDNEKNLNLYIKPNSTIEKREQLINQWYREQLKSLIPDYIDKWQPIIGVKVEEWGVKLMKTRWGSCNTQAKRVWINLELAKKRPRCLEYIIVHEMVHLLERGHNARFYGYMDKFLPQWKSIKAELNGMIYI
jgi:predicted metal-dependent hydrolase